MTDFGTLPRHRLENEHGNSAFMSAFCPHMPHRTPEQREATVQGMIERLDAGRNPLTGRNLTPRECKEARRPTRKTTQ